GKTTIARHISKVSNIDHIELDVIRYNANWEFIPLDEFKNRVSDLIQSDRWIIDGNSRDVQNLIWARATTVIWLDLPLTNLMARVFTRTLTWLVWNTKFSQHHRESIIRTFFSLDSVLLRPIKSYGLWRTVYTRAYPLWERLGVQVFHLRRQREVDRFLS